MPKYKMSNGIKVELTAEEEDEIVTEQTRMTNEIQATTDAETAKEDNKATGKAKLKTGEALNDAEVSALFGD